jgi:hypothetical protein
VTIFIAANMTGFDITISFRNYLLAILHHFTPYPECTARKSPAATMNLKQTMLYYTIYTIEETYCDGFAQASPHDRPLGAW